MNPHQATRWAYRGLLLVAVVVVALFVGSVDLMTVAEDDHSTPDHPPGTRTIVTSVEQDEGELFANALYFYFYDAPDGESLLPRLVRLVGLPGENIQVTPDQVRCGERVVAVPPDMASAWPDRVPDGHCLLLTDQPYIAPPLELHPDSRYLGPMPVERLLFRVVATLGF